MRLLAAELGEHGIRVNGINPDGVVRGSGIFAKGWGAQRAAVYGVPEEELGAFYAQRTLLKREVLPEHVAAAVFALTAGDLVADDRSAHPRRRRRRRGVPALTVPTFVAVDLGATSGRVVNVAGRRATRSSSTSCTGSRPRLSSGTGGRADVGLRCAARRGPSRARRGVRSGDAVESVAVDSWAVDYGLLDGRGRLLGPVHAYRSSRTDGVMDEVSARVGRERIYGITGIQFLPFNTLYQLVAGA